MKLLYTYTVSALAKSAVFIHDNKYYMKGRSPMQDITTAKDTIDSKLASGLLMPVNSFNKVKE